MSCARVVRPLQHGMHTSAGARSNDAKRQSARRCKRRKRTNYRHRRGHNQRPAAVPCMEVTRMHPATTAQHNTGHRAHMASVCGRCTPPNEYCNVNRGPQSNANVPSIRQTRKRGRQANTTTRPHSPTQYRARMQTNVNSENIPYATPTCAVHGCNVPVNFNRRTKRYFHVCRAHAYLERNN